VKERDKFSPVPKLHEIGLEPRRRALELPAIRAEGARKGRERRDFVAVAGREQRREVFAWCFERELRRGVSR
jgi:hypothetical protein